MNRAKLNKSLATRLGITTQAASLLIDEIFTALAENLTEGRNVWLPNIGQLCVTLAPARKRFNAHTQRTYTHPPSWRLVFKPDADLLSRIRAQGVAKLTARS